MASCDLRHFFWQIPIGDNDARWFGVRLRGMRTAYVVKCLPMGFSWSPKIAQIISTLLVTAGLQLVHDAGAGKAYLTVKNSRGLTVAFIVVFYDNFLIIARDERVRGIIVGQLIKNVTRTGARIKAGEEEPTRGILCTRGVFEFLGVLFERGPSGLRWWHKDKSEWAMLGDKKVLSVREGYAMAGVCIWDCTVATRPMLDITEVLDCMSTLGRSDLDWDDKLPEGEEAIMRRGLAKVLTQEPYIRPRKTKATTEYRLVASDASDWGWGVVIFEKSVGEKEHPRQSPVETVLAGQWSEEDRQRPIYQREMMAAVQAINSVGGQGGMILAIDNAAVVSALVHKYSRCDFLREQLRCVDHRLEEVEVVWLPSEKNVADAPSRGREVSTAVAAVCEEWLRDREAVVRGSAVGQAEVGNTVSGLHSD
jgi:hypothetical protein